VYTQRVSDLYQLFKTEMVFVNDSKILINKSGTYWFSTSGSGRNKSSKQEVSFFDFRVEHGIFLLLIRILRKNIKLFSKMFVLI